MALKAATDERVPTCYATIGCVARANADHCSSRNTIRKRRQRRVACICHTPPTLRRIMHSSPPADTTATIDHPARQLSGRPATAAWPPLHPHSTCQLSRPLPRIGDLPPLSTQKFRVLVEIEPKDAKIGHAKRHYSPPSSLTPKVRAIVIPRSRSLVRRLPRVIPRIFAACN